MDRGEDTSPCPGYTLIPNPEDDKLDDYGVSKMKAPWKVWGEDVEGSVQVHHAILNNDLGVARCVIA